MQASGGAARAIPPRHLLLPEPSFFTRPSLRLPEPMAGLQSVTAVLTVLLPPLGDQHKVRLTHTPPSQVYLAPAYSTFNLHHVGLYCDQWSGQWRRRSCSQVGFHRQ